MTYFAKKFQTSIQDSKPEPTPKKKKKPIKKISAKHLVITRQYSIDRKEFLSRPENQKCFIDGCKRKATTIEHTRGKVGFFDEDARMKNIPMYLDQRWWKPCCFDHNSELEKNSKLSHQYQKSKLHKGDKK